MNEVMYGGPYINVLASSSYKSVEEKRADPRVRVNQRLRLTYQTMDSLFPSILITR